MSEWIITTAITLGIGVITYFLKRTMSQVDKHGEEIRRMLQKGLSGRRAAISLIRENLLLIGKWEFKSILFLEVVAKYVWN